MQKAKQIERQDIKLMIDILNNLEVYPTDEHIVESAISMLEDLGNTYHALQLENAKLKEDILQLESMIDN